MLKREKIGVRLAEASRRTEGGRWGEERGRKESRGGAWHVRTGGGGTAQKVQERGEGWIAGDRERELKVDAPRGGVGGEDIHAVGCGEGRERSGEVDEKVVGGLMSGTEE